MGASIGYNLEKYDKYENLNSSIDRSSDVDNEDSGEEEEIEEHIEENVGLECGATQSNIPSQAVLVYATPDNFFRLLM